MSADQKVKLATARAKRYAAADAREDASIAFTKASRALREADKAHRIAIREYIAVTEESQ